MKMHSLTGWFALIVPVALAVADGPSSTVNVTRSDSPTAGVQQAVDSLPESGGTVIIPPGEYWLRQSFHLRSNVTLQGAGTILRKKKHAETKTGRRRPADKSRSAGGQCGRVRCR